MTPEIRAQLIRERKNGAMLGELAERYHVTKERVRQIMAMHDYPTLMTHNGPLGPCVCADCQ